MGELNPKYTMQALYFSRSRRVSGTSQGPSSTPQPLLAPYATEYSLQVRPSIRCASRTQRISVDEEPQSRSRRPSQRQSEDPGGLRASQLAERDYRVAQPDVVLCALLQEPSELREENRHRVLGTFNLQYGWGKTGISLSMFDGTGVRNRVVMAQMYFDSLRETATRRLSTASYLVTEKAFSHWGMLLIDFSEEVPKSWDDMTAMLPSRFSTTSAAATIAQWKGVEPNGDLEATAEEFAAIFANGESVPSAQAKEIFLSRIPYELASRQFKTELKTWA
ncbi:hypothetical protein Efla_004549 [Eimeria flavescens]